MFLLVDRFERILITQFFETANFQLVEVMGILEPLIGVLFIIFMGFLCDFIGRKKIVLAGFVALGLAYAIIGFGHGDPISWYLYFVVDAIAWSTFSLIFILIIWGDLSQHGSKEKYYTLGAIPFYLSGIIPHLFSTIDIEIQIAFSLASFFLFVAVMPLVFAPETLPEKKIELRRLKKFANEATRIKKEFEKKSKRN